MGVPLPVAGLDLVSLVMNGLYERSHRVARVSEVRLSARVEHLRDRPGRRVTFSGRSAPLS